MKRKSPQRKRMRDKTRTDSALLIKIRDILYPLLIRLTGIKVRYRIQNQNVYAALQDKPIIFAANHSAFQDIPIALRATNRRSYVFLGRQNLALIDRIFFLLNGTVWVDRKCKADMAASKETLCAYLQKGQSVLWFPEGTWNLTPDLLILPIKWGIIETAVRSGAQIIPMFLHYDRNRMICSVTFAPPMADSDFDDKKVAISRLRDTLSTMCWDVMCDQKTLCRDEIDVEQMRKEAERVISEYPPLDWEYESTCIFHPYTEPEGAFAFLNGLIPRKENAFLFRLK